MDRENILNQYVEENEDNLKEKDNAQYYLERLQFRINGSKSLYEVVREVSKFLDKENVPSLIRSELESICQGFTENTDVYTAQTKLEECLSKYVDEKEKDYNQSNDTIKEIKDELLDKSEKKMDDVGVSFEGDREEIMDDIKDEDAVDRIQRNVDTAYDALKEKEDLIDDEDLNINSTVNYDIVEDIVDSPKDDVLLDAILEDELNKHKDDKDILELREDGSLEISGDIEKPSTMNFAAMMTLMLVTNDKELSLNTNLDMKFIKDKDDLTKFRVIFGDFPLNPDNKIDEVWFAKINNQASLYDKTVDYMGQLSFVDPSLGQAFTMINDNIFDQKGGFQMAVRNNGNNCDVKIGVDEEYSNIREAFDDQGADITNTGDTDVVSVEDIEYPDNIILFTNVNEELREKKKAKEAGLSNQKQYKKVMEQPSMYEQAGNVNVTFLKVVGIANAIMGALLIGSFLLK